MPSVYITDEVHDRMKERAKSQDRSVRAQTNRDLTEFLDSLLDEKKDVGA